MKHNHYVRLLIMGGLSFVSMYALMYAMVDRWANVYPNVNQLYMAGLMTAPMIVFELLLMGAMYEKKKLNFIIGGISVIAMVAFWSCIRAQAGVTDTQFLKSMIPHHAGAILMCEDGSVTDPEIKALCESIKRSQTAEIEQMRAKLTALGE